MLTCADPGADHIEDLRTRGSIRDDGVPDVEHFLATYRMDCASAAQRLLRSGLPATIEHRPARRGARRAGAPARAAR